jgi:hypothetical protein
LYYCSHVNHEAIRIHCDMVAERNGSGTNGCCYCRLWHAKHMATVKATQAKVEEMHEKATMYLFICLKTWFEQSILIIYCCKTCRHLSVATHGTGISFRHWVHKMAISDSEWLFSWLQSDWVCYVYPCCTIHMWIVPLFCNLWTPS